MRYFIAIFLFCFLFLGCKKYPEGGFEKRGQKILLKRLWTLTLYEVNGIDSTDLLNLNGDSRYKEVTFYEEDTHYNPNLYVNCYPSLISRYEFHAHEEIRIKSDINGSEGIKCAQFNSSLYGCFRTFMWPENVTINWKVEKLTKKEMILTSSQKNNYKLKFKGDKN